MGAKIMLCDPHRAVVMGHDFKSQLKTTTMSSPDIRAGIFINRRSFSKRNKYDPKH
jgi:UDP-N-acetylglucosamine enolpyruvyl transferase